MTQYIPKAAVVAEIKRRIEINNTCQKISGGNEFYRGAIDEAKEILSFLDTLEVKEVDLEKEIDNYLSTYWNEEREKLLHPFLKKMCVHFFELGMLVSNKAQKGEEA